MGSEVAVQELNVPFRSVLFFDLVVIVEIDGSDDQPILLFLEIELGVLVGILASCGYFRLPVE